MLPASGRVAGDPGHAELFRQVPCPPEPLVTAFGHMDLAPAVVKFADFRVAEDESLRTSLAAVRRLARRIVVVKECRQRPIEIPQSLLLYVRRALAQP